MKRKLIIIFMFLLTILSVVVPIQMKTGNAFALSIDGFDLTAKSALLMDYDTGKIVFEKNINDRLPIASMTKIATLAVVFDAIEKGYLKENDKTQISHHAASTGGSSAFLDEGASYEIGDLIKSVIIASANDSAVALAEHLAGTEEHFVSKMNKLAENLNLTNTHFENCTGLPNEKHYSSAYDIAQIYKLIGLNPIYLRNSKVWTTCFLHPSGRRTDLVNTNRLVKSFDGIDGGKTGFTSAAKFCLTASACRNGTRFIGVVIGVDDSKTRFAEMSKLLNFGFANYVSNQIVQKEIPVTITKFNRSKQMVNVYPEKNFSIFMEKTSEMKYTTDYDLKELKAPIKAGDVVGTLYIFDENNIAVGEVNLIVNETVNQQTFKDGLLELINKW